MVDVFQSTATLVSPAFNQAVNALLANLLQFSVLALTALVSYAVKTWVASLKSDQQKSLAFKLVSFAEQRIVNNEAKLTYVKSKLKEALPRLSDTDIDHSVEEAVLALKASLPSSPSSPAAAWPSYTVTTNVPIPPNSESKPAVQ